MSHDRLTRALATLVLLAALTFNVPAYAAEVQDLQGFDDIFGRYAPGGDCKKQPQILVDVSGFTFEVDGKREKVTNAEYAASYGPHDYAGISKWFFPFRLKDGYSILMTFNSDEQKGVLTIHGHDEGYAGGPPFSPLNQALVSGSPYVPCK